MITEETIVRMKQNLEVKNEFFILDVIKHFETQIEQLQQAYTITVDKSVIREQELKKENEGLKRNLSRYSEKIAEQEETIDAQDEKINFYVSKMNKALIENKQLKAYESHWEEIEEDTKVIAKENAELKVFSKKLIETNNKLRDSLRKYEVVPDVDYLPNGIEIYKENVGNNPYSKE